MRPSNYGIRRDYIAGLQVQYISWNDLNHGDLLIFAIPSNGYRADEIGLELIRCCI